MALVMDLPGVIGNRLQHALRREAISLVVRGICDAAAVIRASFGRRLAVPGSLETADLVGTDLTLGIHNTELADLENRAEPSPSRGPSVQRLGGAHRDCACRVEPSGA